jgi:hypothetical protein
LQQALTSDGRWLTWLAWDHPNMPWNGTTLWLSELDEAGNVAESLTVAGGVSESVFQPEWSRDGRAIFFVSDRSGWWNLLPLRSCFADIRAACADGC